MERTPEPTQDAISFAGWLLIMAVVCGGCRTPIHHGPQKTPIARCQNNCCNGQHPACDACATCCEPSCYGYEPTCWARWPAECPSNCPIDGDVPADAPIILHEELISDGVHEQKPAWEMSSNDGASAPDSPQVPGGHMLAGPLPSAFSARAEQPTIFAKAPAGSHKSGNESLTPRRIPLAEDDPDLSAIAQFNAPVLTDEHVQILSKSMAATHKQDAPTVADPPTSGTTSREGKTPVSSRRRARKQQVRVPEIAQTAAIATTETLSKQGMVRTADLQLAPTRTSKEPVSSRRQPMSPPITFTWSEQVSAIPPLAVPMPAAPAWEPNSVTKIDQSSKFNIRRLPAVESVNAAAPEVTHRTNVDSNKNTTPDSVMENGRTTKARRVSSDDTATIRFAKDKTRTPAGSGAANGTSSTVRFR